MNKVQIGDTVLLKIDDNEVRAAVVVKAHADGLVDLVTFYCGAQDSAYTGDGRCVDWSTSRKQGNEVGEWQPTVNTPSPGTIVAHTPSPEMGGARPITATEVRVQGGFKAPPTK